MKTKTEVANILKKKKERKKRELYKNLLLFITIFPWGRALDCWTAASEDPWSVPLELPLEGSGRVVKTISILCASLSLVGS